MPAAMSITLTTNMSIKLGAEAFKRSFRHRMIFLMSGEEYISS